MFGLLRRRKTKDNNTIDVLEEPTLTKGNFIGGISSIQDLIAPDGIEETPAHIRIGSGRFIRTFVVSQLPSRVFVGFLDEVYRAGDVDVSIHIVPADRADVVGELNRKVMDMETEMMLAEKAGNTANYSIFKQTWEDAWLLREELQTGQNRVFYVTILFTIAADSEERLNSKCRSIEQQLAGASLQVRETFLRQQAGLRSVSPLGTNEINDVYHNLDLAAGTALYPFADAELAHPGGAILGVNAFTGAPVVYNSFIGPPTLPNQHMAVIAISGAGKTTFVKLLTARSALQGVPTVFLDPEGDYVPMVRNLGGTVVRLTANGPTFINPFDIEQEIEDGKATVNLPDKVLDVKTLVALAIQSQGGTLSPEENMLVEEALYEEYASLGITSDPSSLYTSETRDGVFSTAVKKEMPTFSSFATTLKGKGEMGARLASLLRPFLHGGTMAVFDGQSQFDLGQELLVTFDISRLEERFMRPFALQVLLGWVWEKFVKRDPTANKRVVVDEAWMFMKHDYTANFLEDMARRARKQSCALIIATQHFLEFSERTQGRAVMANMGSLTLMQQAPEEIDAVVSTFKLSTGQQEFIRTLGVGQALLRAGKQFTAVNVIPADMEYDILGINRH